MFELVEALSRGCKLHVVLSRADEEGFQTLLEERFSDIAGIVAALDAKDAQISKVDDRDFIMGRVRRLEGGLGAVTATVCAAMRDWLAGAGRAALARLPEGERGTSLLLYYLGRMLLDQGKLSEAEPLMRENLEARRKALGSRHPNTLASMTALGLLLN